jgi:hypothetical protein
LLPPNSQPPGTPKRPPPVGLLLRLVEEGARRALGALTALVTVCSCSCSQDRQTMSMIGIAA